MDGSQIDALVLRLVNNPHDEEALSSAHQAGALDPKSYALLLERVGAETRDSAYASHWLSEAANVWSTTLGDAHRAARVLMQAIERDPTQRTAADRLAQLYRDKGDVKALVALLERRAKALAPMATQNPEIRAELGAMHEELGRLWNESLQQPKKAIENFRRSIEFLPSSPYAIYGAREIYKSLGQWDDAIQMYEAELAIEQDPARQLALLNDEAATRRAAGDLAGAARALERARRIDAQDPQLQQQYGALIVERLAAGESVPTTERIAGAELLVGLAEAYDGEHGFAYSAGALDIEPGHDRALQLYTYYARALGREDDVSIRYLAYVNENPTGAMAADARWLLAASYEAASQFENAIQILEPLRGLGDAQATARVVDLYARIEKPVPSAPPPPQPRAAPAVEPPVEAAPTEGTRRAAGSTDKLQDVLDDAQTLANKGRRAEAYQKYREVLEVDAAHPEALSWVEDYLRAKRDYGALRDVLLAAARSGGGSIESRKERLREVAGLCEGNLRDPEGAINAWKLLLGIERADEGARASLSRLLEKANRWDELAQVLEQEATIEGDLEKKIALEKKLATLHESKRGDLGAAAEAWTRIANLTPDDDDAVTTASRMFEESGALDRAAQVITVNLASVTVLLARGPLLERLGALREKLGDPGGAAQAYAEAAEALKSPKLWEAAERCFVSVEAWERAAPAAVQRANETVDARPRAEHLARAADYFRRAGDDANLVSNLELAVDLDPGNKAYATPLGDLYASAQKWDELVRMLGRRADRLSDTAERVAVRRQAAKVYSSYLADNDGAREMWLKVLGDGDDTEALERLIDDAIEREDRPEAITLLRRLGNITTDPGDRARIALREAELLGEGLGDVDAAIACYERILSDIDPACRPALQAIADLQEARDNPKAAIGALESELKLVTDATERGQIAGRLARLYEQIDDPKRAIAALEMVREIDPDDFEALKRLCELCERTEQWEKVAELLAQRIEIEADESESSLLTKKLSSVLQDKLDRGDEALAALTELADIGDSSCREAYIELGDRLGWRGIVATKLVEWWFEAKQSAERTSSLRGAFERFAEVGRDQDAVRVACEIVRSKGADRELAERLEHLSIKTSDLDALAIAHDLLARELAGLDRAKELVRQAEARLRAGAPNVEALQHGEAGLTSVPPGEAEELLVRLAAIAETASEVVDLYERQIMRCKGPADRVKALARASQVASARGLIDRARGFFDLALSGTPSEETLSAIEQAAHDGDAETGTEALRRALCAALAAGGQGARDGGRTRGGLMRRAAHIAHHELKDVDQAFAWLGDALIAYVEVQTLDALEGLANEIGDPRRAEATLTRALAEVFDGPLVRQLFARRARLRRERLDDKPGAAADLKKLHDLAPSDQGVMDELSGLLAGLGDHRGMVQLYEDHILRGKDMAARAELARKVASMWEEQLADPREAADAWRRVLRMKPGDPEATAGLERAKSNMLKKPTAVEDREANVLPASHSALPEESTEPVMEPPGRDTLDEGPGNAQPATVTPDDRPSRPEEPLFRTSQDEITESAPHDIEREIDQAALASSEPALTLASDALLRKSEPSESDQDKVPLASESDQREVLPPASESDQDKVPPAFSQGKTDPPDGAEETVEGPAGDLEATGVADFEEDIVIGDDLAEMVDSEEAEPVAVPPPQDNPPPEKAEKKSDKKKRKRSLPPPVSRG